MGGTKRGERVERKIFKAEPLSYSFSAVQPEAAQSVAAVMHMPLLANWSQHGRSEDGLCGCRLSTMDASL